MDHLLPQSIALLTRTPAVLQALLRDLPASLTERDEGQNTWTPHDVVAHLLHTERSNWLGRAKMILESGESQPFTPLDREANREASRSKPLAALLDDFAGLRNENLAELHALHLKPADLERRGRHPAFGVVTLSQLLATWAAHDLTHLHQLSRILAHQYREAVGPWNAYLGVLKCAGHSSAA
jgi:DinB family protein